MDKKLPDGWALVALREITMINPGVDVSILPNSILVSFVPMSAIEAGTGRMDSSQKRRLSEVKRGYTAFLENDILFAKITPCMENGKFAIAHDLSSGIGFGSTEFHVLRPENGINPQLLYYYLSQDNFRSMARKAMSGAAGYLRVSSAFIANVFYPLPPTNEQARIVSAIQQLFSRLDSAVDSLYNAQRKTILYRASLLKSAIEGELTKEWRTKYPANETGAQLLEHILDERRTEWEMGKLAKMREKGITPKDDKWKQVYKEPQAPIAEKLLTLPEGWCWATVEQLADVSTGATPLRSRSDYYERGTIPWVTISSINNTFITDTEEYITEKALEETNVKVFPAGTLILAMHGESKTKGKVSELKVAAATNQACAAITLRPSSFPCQPYLRCFFMSNYFAMRSFAVNNAQLSFNLNLTFFKETIIPLPPLAEQAQIVAEVEARLSEIAQTEKIIEDNLRRASRERQSILHEAFAGQLLSQEAVDEPVSTLLVKIFEGKKRKIKLTQKGHKSTTHKDIVRRIKNQQESAGKRYLGLYEKLVKVSRPVSPAELFNQIGLESDADIEDIESFYEELSFCHSYGLVTEERIDEDKILLNAK